MKKKDKFVQLRRYLIFQKLPFSSSLHGCAKVLFFSGSLRYGDWTGWQSCSTSCGLGGPGIENQWMMTMTMMAAVVMLVVLVVLLLVVVLVMVIADSSLVIDDGDDDEDVAAAHDIFFYCNGRYDQI